MYQAAIVEDEPNILNHIKESLIDSFTKRQVPVAFDTFLSGTKFLRMFEEHYHYDIIFLDIEMPEIDGIEVCRRIRRISPDSLVVFISSRDELVFQTFEVQPYRFIRKETFQESLPALTAAITEKWAQDKGSSLCLREAGSGDLYSFSLSQILYIEAQRKDCLIVTADGSHLFRCRLMELEDTLSAHYFIKTHRSYLVNCRHIFTIGKDHITLTNGVELPVSRGKAEALKQTYLRYHTRF